jgi:putative CocE/NonD family hydrolase
LSSTEQDGMARRTPRFAEVLIRANVPVPMRDGVTLDTDIYLPAEDGHILGNALPALLARTPYSEGKADSNNAEAMRLARHGYMVVWQHVRGRFASAGTFSPFMQEAEDGYDAIEWVAAQPTCDGRVGTFGGSYLAWAQAAAATQRPPHLAAMSLTFGYPHGYHSVHQGGALDVFWLSYLVMMAGDGKEAQGSAHASVALAGMGASFDQWLARLPLREGLTPLALAPSYERTYFDFVRHACLDAYWAHPGRSPADYLDRWPDIPVLWQCGWFDHYPYCHPDTLAFTRLAELGHHHQVVIFGPWTHGSTAPEQGHASFGAMAALEATFPDLELRWFDRQFKGIDDDDLCSVPVRYFVMGGGTGTKTAEERIAHGGTWKNAARWPPTGMVAEHWYVHEGGLLLGTPPTLETSHTTYRADPQQPVPSSTGVCYTVSGGRRISPNGAWDQVEGAHLFGVTPPYLPLSTRSDVLVFQSEPLADDIEVIGHPTVELWISTDALDTDVVAKLIDVYPPSADFPSSWPHFDVNTHTGQNPSLDHDWRIAHNTLYHQDGHHSGIVLPVMRQPRGVALSAPQPPG